MEEDGAYAHTYKKLNKKSRSGGDLRERKGAGVDGTIDTAAAVGISEQTSIL